MAIDKELRPEELVDFGASDAAMSDAEIERVARGVRLLPMTAGAVVLAYNLPGFEGELRLSREALAGIFLGEISNWNDPKIKNTNRGKLPNLTISVVTRRDSSGTTFAMTNHLSAISSACARPLRRSESGRLARGRNAGRRQRGRGRADQAGRRHNRLRAVWLRRPIGPEDGCDRKQSRQVHSTDSQRHHGCPGERQASRQPPAVLLGPRGRKIPTRLSR